MALYKRGPVYWIRLTYEGRLMRKSLETTDRKLAQRIHDKIRGQIAEEKWFERLPGEDKTFRELVEKYMGEHSAKNKAESSHIRDKSLFHHLLQFFGDCIISKIAPKLISEYKSRRTEEQAAPATINKELGLMGHAFTLAVKEWEWVLDNPVARVSRKKVRNSKERWLTVAEEKKLLSVCPQWLREIIVFALNTGFRRGEILNLQWPHVDLSRKTITILEQKNQETDTLPLNKNALDVLKTRIRIRYIQSNFVFCNSNGKKMSGRNLARGFYSATKKVGLQGVRFHDLRHTWASRMVQAGVDIYKVQKLGRWKSISMVMRYAHHYTESLRSGVEALDHFPKKHNLSTIRPKSEGSQNLTLISD